MRKVLLFTTTVFSFFVTGCLSYPIPKYPINVRNIETLKNSNLTQMKLISSVAEKASLSSITCRMAGPVKISDGTTFGKYIINSISDELRMAEKLNESSNNILTLDIKEVDMKTTSAQWKIVADMKFKNQTQSISHVQSFETSFIAENACREIANNFVSAVESFNLKVIDAAKDMDKLSIKKN